jgi:radical SAM protein with 4Fe4S-binding SPASM domain
MQACRLRKVFTDADLVGDVEEFCAVPGPVDDEVMEGLPCSAGHTSCYLSPYGDLYPCVQFPLTCGNVRREKFQDIWDRSPQLADVRAIRGKHLSTCSGCSHLGTCTRCPGLANREGDMRGPSSADCEKSFVRTGVTAASFLAGNAQNSRAPGLVQIQLSAVSLY